MPYRRKLGKHLGLIVGFILWTTTLDAHEGHAPLPTKGLRVEGERLVLSRAATKALGVQTAKIELRDLEKTVRAHATVKTPLGHLAYATTLVGGTIVEVLATPGDRVERGQVLARVQSAELESLQLDVLQAADEFSLAERLLREREKVGESISGRLLLETRATRDQKAAEVAVARQKLASLGLAAETIATVESEHSPITTLPITSPIDGTIAEADVRVGQVVTPTEHLYHIIDLSQVWVVGDVIETQAAGLAADQPVRCEFESLAGQVFEGTLDHVGVKLSEERRTQAATATLDNRDGALRSGMFGRMQIVVDKRKQCVVCPAQAVYRIGAKDFVLVDDGPAKFARRKVQVGLRTAGGFEITDGLFPGDRVVTVGRQELAASLGPPPGEKSTPATTQHLGSRTGEMVLATGRVVLPTGAKSFASTAAEGRVAEIKVVPGQRVAKGQVLAEIESLKLENLQLDWLLAISLESWTGQTLRALEPLGASRAIPERELWLMRTKNHTYRHQVESLAHRLKFLGVSEDELDHLSGLNLSSTTDPLPTQTRLPLRAPADGVIADLHIDLGQVVKPDDQLFEIQNLNRVWVQANLFETDAALVRPGQAATVEITADPVFAARGVVTRVSPELSAQSHVLPVWVELDNADHRLKGGMSARVRIEVGG